MIHRYSDVLELIEHSFRSFPGKIAFSCMGKALTYQELDALSASFAVYLQQGLGLQPGDRIAIQLPNILQFPVAFYGAVRAGLVVVNVNPLYTSRELTHQLVDSQAQVLVVLSNIAHNAAKIIADTEVKKVIVTNIGDLHGFPKKHIINFVVKHVKKMVPAYQFSSQIEFNDTLNGHSQSLVKQSIEPSQLLMLQYTGGTTGISKGAMLTHANLANNVWQMVSHMPNAFDEGEETFIACLPLYHIYGLNLHALAAFSTGQHNVLIPNPRDLAAMVAELKRVKMTVFVGISTLFIALCRFDKFKEVDFSTLETTSSGGMALTESAAHMWAKTTGCEVCEGYGLTETSPVLLGNKSHDIVLGTIGIPLPETEIILLDEDGNEVGIGDVGELCARGPQVMLGYWNRPDETADTMTADGYFRTGDMAIKREDGRYKIVDRKKDMIIVSGFNVYPNEVEDMACLHPKIIEAAAVGVADESSGEIVKLFVVRDDESLTVEDIRAFCKTKLTAYKVPKIVEFRDELPKTNVGKILRRELRDGTA